ncbi:MAG: radical SAM protein [Euryarchaeota archaeon]|nr:radical SAM protein [Euryarchaeota archaeon]
MSSLDSFGLDVPPTPLRVRRKKVTTALSPSRLPGLDYALNPYTRCGHNCTYCYAPYIMRISPKEWGQGIEAKVNIPRLLDRELPKKQGVIGLGTVTDPYQPVEERLLLTRRCLKVLQRHNARVSVLTKSALVARDADILTKMEGSEVGITITTISDQRSKIFEPCAPPPSKRLGAMRTLHDSKVSVYALLGPIIPTISDYDLEGLVTAIERAGASMIMIDRLNMRPGMEARMLERMRMMDPASLPILESALSDRDFYRSAAESIRRLCKDRGLICKDAF